MFITLEGIDKVGKTTIITQLYNKLRMQRNIFLTSEPYGIEYGKDLASHIMHLNAYGQLYAFLSIRAEHSQLISKYLKENYIVLCDRYIDSTLAYQGAKIGLEKVKAIISHSYYIEPDLTFIIEGKQFSDYDSEDKFEDKEYLKQVKYIFDQLKSQHRIITLNNCDADIIDIMMHHINFKLALS